LGGSWPPTNPPYDPLRKEGLRFPLTPLCVQHNVDTSSSRANNITHNQHTWIIFPIFRFESSCFGSLLLLTSLVENDILRGFNPLVMLLSSRGIISFKLYDSFQIKEQMLSSFGKTCHDSSLLGILGRNKDRKVQSGLWGINFLVGEATKKYNLSTIELNSLLMWVMLKDNRFWIKVHTTWVYCFSSLLLGL